ncbi:glycosyltransferase [Ornithinimicrobium pekingense]|uniref:Glycosyltransferase 2-like domain-containing protein n=1 Tax=Ornithinimicrobium pekingense TaxID=384677 RepID=A0ABQ2F3F7_9MICO|nr:glycosyltransferase [Ornithinimicrobium pekingense]GGK56953.1 hypothetical protein GCM10011509_01670 [Ornithinimicrobium pekingense]
MPRPAVAPPEERLLGAALRGQHDATFDALARHARAGAPARSLAVRLADGAPVPDRATVPGSTLPFAVALATAWFGAARDEVEQRAGVELYRQVVAARGPRALRPVERRHYLQAAFLLGRHDLVRQGLEQLDGVSADVVEGLRADLVNPHAEGTQQPATHERWQELLGSRFVARDLRGPEVDPSLRPVFDGLRLTADRSVDGPLVSVVVPAFRPDRGLVTSVASVLAQSWGNLEVLLVDDASGPGYAELFAECEALDDRVRLLRQEVNGGSYLARAAALAVARGDHVTTQDADDWSHPERIALQVGALDEAPAAAASRSTAIRARPDLTRQWFGYRPERMNASSLLVRRDLLEQVGGFDAIRKGADSELQERLELVGGVVNVVRPLAVTRLAAGSLSRADFALGRHSPDRVLFRSAFRHWHAGLARAGANAPEDVRLRREGMRPFPVPRGFVRDLPGARPARTAYPLVVVVDQADPLPAGVDEELRSLVLGGGDPVDGNRPPVAVLGREDLTRAGAASPGWSPELLDAARQGRVDLVTDTDAVHAEVLVVLEPSVLALPAVPLPRATADRVLVAAVPPSVQEPPRDLESAGAFVREHLGRVPRWVARSVADQEAWEREGWSVPLLLDDLRPGRASVARAARRSLADDAPHAATDDPVARLREALALVAEAERAEPALPGRADDVLLLGRDRVVRRPELDPRVAALVPGRSQRAAWDPDDEGVTVLPAPVAADLVVLGKFDLQRRPKLRAVYADAGLTLVVQPPSPSSGSGVARAVRAHEVVERHAPDLVPPMVGHGVLGGGMPYLVERWLPGAPLAGARQLTAAAPQILTGLAAVHRGHGVTPVRLTDHWGGGFAERWRETCRTDVVPASLAAWVQDLLDRDGELRRSFIHGDLVASNVLSVEDRVVLVDWEQAHEGLVMNDAAKLHLFGAEPEEVLDLVVALLVEGAGAGGTAYLPLEELALCHAQLVSLYPRRSARLAGHPRAEAYERQVRRQVERLEQVRRRLGA